MRVLISILMMGQLMGCMQHAAGRDNSNKTSYLPHPRVELSVFTARDRIVAVYVRHSRGAVLFRLSSDIPDDACAVRACSPRSVVTLSQPADMHFCSAPYENFDRSFDMFGDGTVVLVPLAEGDSNGAGLFVNLVSGKSYFFMPLLTEVDYLPKLRRRINVITAEHLKSAEKLPKFPEFER